MYNLYQKFTNKDPRSQCNASICPLECETNVYPLDISTTSLCPNYVTFLYNHTMRDLSEVDVEKMKAKMASINVYYPNLKYTNITQLGKMKWVDVISGVGGFSGNK